MHGMPMMTTTSSPSNRRRLGPEKTEEMDGRRCEGRHPPRPLIIEVMSRGLQAPSYPRLPQANITPLSAADEADETAMLRR